MRVTLVQEYAAVNVCRVYEGWATLYWIQCSGQVPAHHNSPAHVMHAGRAAKQPLRPPSYAAAPSTAVAVHATLPHCMHRASRCTG